METASKLTPVDVRTTAALVDALHKINIEAKWWEADNIRTLRWQLDNVRDIVERTLESVSKP